MNHKVLLFLFLFLSFLPDNFSNDVLTNNSNAVKAAVGLPDKLIIIELLTILQSTADPGLIFTFQNNLLPLILSMASFNKSFSPTDTPPVVIIKSNFLESFSI